MQHCQNCDKSLSAEKFDLHLGYCRRNIKRCVQCNLPYDVNNIEQHKEEFHKFQNCLHCFASFNANQKQKHDQSCEAKPIACSICELLVPVQIFQSHRLQCQSRTSKCQICEKIIPNREIMNHSQNCQGPIENQPTWVNPKINKRICPAKQKINDGRLKEQSYRQKRFSFGGQVENYQNVFQAEDHELQAALLASLGHNLGFLQNVNEVQGELVKIED